MAIKWTSRGTELEADLAEAGRAVLRSPALVGWCERAIGFLLGAILAGGQIFQGAAPFGIGLVACAGSGLDGLCTLLGATLGYLLFYGVAGGIRYAAACVLVFSVAFAFFDAGVYVRGWFMPVVAAGMDALTGFVYLSDSAWQPAQVAFFTTEVLLCGISARCYRLALIRWRCRSESAPLTYRQAGGLLFLLGSLLISLAGVTFLGDLSLGRVITALLVMAVARAGGLGAGAAAGVSLGLGMDLAAAGGPFYAIAYGFSGLLTGAGRRQGRLFGAISYVVANAAVVLWSWEESRISGLYEVFIASVCFLLLPEGWLRRLTVLLTREREGETTSRAAAYVSERLSATARAFREVRDSLRASFPPTGPNDADPSTVFDRTAERVCRSCALRNTCWEHDYMGTYNALNDALPAMLEKGKGESADFPGWFTSRCMQFSAFLKAANEEVIALRYRRQYKSRLRESRGAVYRQYETLADILTAASAELSVELTPDPVREKRLREYLAGLDQPGETAVYYDGDGRLRCEVEGEELESLKKTLSDPGELDKLSRLMGVPLRRDEEAVGRVVLLQAEPLAAVAGAAARRREGQRESGDTGTWFKRPDGSLFVLLCDGMGSGEDARKESALAVRLLEEFLRAGMESSAAMGTVNSALALRNEETGAFTTVDLLRLDLYTGHGELCKLGAAPTYVKRKGTVSRISGAALPAGLTDGERVGPDVTRLDLSAGDCVLLVSDGIADAGEDQWVRELLKGFDGESPKDLARVVMEESEKRVGAADDRTAVVIQLKKRS